MLFWLKTGELNIGSLTIGNFTDLLLRGLQKIDPETAATRR
jgi:hypothetical protein